MVLLRGPIIVNAVPQHICRYAAVWAGGPCFFAAGGLFAAGAQNARPYCCRGGEAIYATMMRNSPRW